MNPLIQLKKATPLIVIAILLACFGLAPMAQGVGPDTDGSIADSNNGEGIGVLVSRTVGIWNTGTGFEALNHLTAGNQNTATGLRALFSDINGGFNTATGVYSLFGNTIGFFNSATGAYSLANNTIGSYNTANGYGALNHNTEGEQNAATGFAALYRNTTGYGNVANGSQALNRNTTGSFNTANGLNALASNTTGSSNTALGAGAGSNLTTGNGNIDIGNIGVAGEFHTIRIGMAQTRTFIAGISIAAVTGVPVVVNASGQLGVTPSSQRFKDEISSMDKASEAILALRPVTFRYKHEIDPRRIPQFGLVAEEVEKVNPDLVVRDENGEIYTVCYDAVNAMLLNEFLKAYDRMQEQGRKVEHQEATIAELKSTITQLKSGVNVLTATLKEQAAQIRKVSDHLELNKTAPRTVVSNP
jgi:hypothetical protein